MRRDIPESDWRHFKRLHQVLSERFCRGVIEELGALLQTKEGSAHERYRRAYQLLQERDEELARAFNDFRRSTAVLQMMLMRRMGLLADEELAVFSQETQEMVRRAESLRQGETGHVRPKRDAQRGSHCEL